MAGKTIKVALVGNPNSGKTSLFNQLTGLNQKVGNFPGVTVDKKVGFMSHKGHKFEIIDLPGTYSIYPKSLDEQVVSEIILNKKDPYFPDICVITLDSTHLKRHLLLATQLLDLGIPTIIGLNMLDEAEKENIHIDTEKLKTILKSEVVGLNSRKGHGIPELKDLLIKETGKTSVSSYEPDDNTRKVLDEMDFDSDFNYAKVQVAHQYRTLNFLSDSEKNSIKQLIKKHNFDSNLNQVEETLDRYQQISSILSETYEKLKGGKIEQTSNKIDKILTHKVFGYVIFALILFILFQSIFSLASYPMDLIDEGISLLNGFVSSAMPAGPLRDLLTEGIISGIGGVVIFIPQIALLFAFLAVLEETGYMARVTFIMDKLMRKVGLNGRSVVPLVSSIACAVPAIMSARTIDNWKDRIITIFVTPLISCSARIPVYTIIIALIIPDKTFLGILNLQGVVMFAMYLLGFLAALGTSYAMKLILKSKGKDYFIMELPVYRWPRWGNVSITIFEKVKTFVFSAGKIILAISIVLWVLASYGGAEKLTEFENTLDKATLSEAQIEQAVSTKKLEYSYAGQFGKLIEPTIKPLGFDWKIGIALITSFAAREVFVGTMATIYSIDSEDENTLKNKMREAKNPDGTPFFGLAMGLSLLVFYALAMQCMSTLAATYRETKGWKWPILQTVYMTGLAYVSSLVIFWLFS